ncbi:fibronectin type III domain-containing protein [bacterium]|nr:fibronectin type III domain-containing protein [bacterium]
MAVFDRTKRFTSAPIHMFLMVCSLLLLAAPLYARDVSFAWTPNQDPVTGYRLYYKTGSDPADPFTGIGINEGNSPIAVGDTSSFTVTGLSDTETYQFALTAFNDTGESGFSEIVTISPLNTKDVSFAWTANPAPVTGYKLYYKRGGEAAPPFDGQGLIEGDSPIMVGNDTTATVTGLDPEDTYHFALTAYDASGESDYSEIVTISGVPAPVILNIRLQ